MFTGLIEKTGEVISARAESLTIAAGDILQEIKIGGSIDVNGVCLTITNLDTKSFSVGIMSETLRRSNLGLLSTGDRVNLELPLRLGGRLDGHLVQGHVDATGKVESIRWEGGAMLVGFEAPRELMPYIAEKGFIAVDGISLTVVEREGDSFKVSVVDYTRRHTTLGERRVGDRVNLEVDIIAKYVEQLSQKIKTGVTLDFLQRQGFIVS